jgi:hypothetical protein
MGEMDLADSEKAAMPPFAKPCALSLVALVSLPLLALPVQAQQYQFAPSPQTDLNRVYRIDRQTGELGACQYGLKENAVGVTLCFAAGDGAGPQDPSDYALIPSRHEREGGIFRVDQKSGAMSVCYVYEEKVVCTPAAK